MDNEVMINMNELAAFAFPDLVEITAMRKTTKAFKRACNQLGISAESFKTGRDYAIPKASLPVWKLLVRNIDAVEGNTSVNGYSDFIESVIETKSTVDEQFDSIDFDTPELESYQQSMLKIYEMFYTDSSHAQPIAMILHNQLIQTIQEDMKYIIENTPTDRTVMYTEMYYNEIKRKAEKMGVGIKKMISEQWWNE
ncbi:hypothetical protein [Sporosarcina sp. FA9]|uniref:hypothetical protein n=1 Tax=Sporosarcina sp. FA9 TaxID=3413030 RepID=UPI003F657C7C